MVPESRFPLARRTLLAAVFVLAGGGPLSAAEDADLDFIPGAILAVPPAPADSPPSAAGRFSAEDGVTLSALRPDLAVPPPSDRLPPRWEHRTSLDGRGKWEIATGLRAALSDRFGVVEESRVSAISHDNIRNDFREGYLTWEPQPQTYLELGRINLRDGVATGFSPTDVFRTRSLVDQASLDPRALRENRLGALMVHAQTVLPHGSLALAFAPRVTGESALSAGPPPSLDPRFGATNGSNRLLLSASADLGADISPRFLLFRQGSRTRFGTSLSRPVSDSVVLYAEWMGGRETSLAGRALAFATETGTLPASASALALFDSRTAFRNDLAIGGSWTSAANVTVNLEYYFHQSGFSRSDWDRWFAAGRASGASPLATAALWYIRDYARDQQELTSRQQAFARVQWTDAFVRHLSLSAFALVDLYDGSSLMQTAATYHLSDHWTIAALATANIGGSRSNYGSLPQQASGTLQIVKYF